MMTKQTAAMIWDHLRQMNGISVRLIEQLTDADLDKRPVTSMRTPKQLVVHMYLTCVKAVTEGIVTGEIPDRHIRAARRSRIGAITHRPTGGPAASRGSSPSPGR